MKLLQKYSRYATVAIVLWIAVLLASCVSTPAVETGSPSIPVTPMVATPFNIVPESQTPQPGTAATETQQPATPASASESPTETEIPGTAVISTSGAVPGNVIQPTNAQNLQEVSGVRLNGARLFAWMPDSQSLAIATETEIVFYNLSPLKETMRLDAPQATMMAISPDGQILAWVSEDNTIHIWSIPEAKETQALGPHKSALTSLAFSPDSSILAIATSENSIELWNPASGQNIQNWKLAFWVSDLSFSPDGVQLAAAELPTFTEHFWSVPDGSETRKLVWNQSVSPSLYGAELTKDWKMIAWVARGTVQLMDVTTGNTGPSLEHEDAVSAIALSPDGKLVASAAAGTVNGNFSPVVYLWNSATGQQTNNVVQTQPVTGLDFSPDGLILGILTYDHVLQLWGVPK
jgi:WD40 repeat protein